MADDLMVNRARSVTTRTPGRSITSARTNHVVIDEPAYIGGPEEAMTPIEVFLGGVSSCGVLLVELVARQTGVPFERGEVAVEAVRSPSDRANFQSMSLRFELTGPSPEQAAQLVETYKAR